MIKSLLNKKGLTLIELIVTLAIFGLIVMVAYPMLSFTYRTSNTQLKESNQRNEVRVVSTHLRNDITYSKDISLVNSSTLKITDTDGNIITYSIDASKNALVRDASIPYVFEDIEDIEFDILNDHLVEAKIITDSINDKYTEFKIFRWNMTIKKPVDDIHTIIVRDKVFVLGNQVVVERGSTVSGSDAAVIVRNNLNLTGSSVQYIATKNIYIDGNVTLDKGAGIGKSDSTSSIYITGNCTVTGSGRLYGNSIIDGALTVNSASLSGDIYVDGDFKVLGGSYSEFLKMPTHIYYTGSISLPKGFRSVQATKVSSIEDIVFPSITIPPMQQPNWYAERGYTSNQTSKSNMKYYGGGYTFKYNNGNTFDNVIIASKGNITISGDKHVTGVLFAPNHDVTISGGSSFKGLIIAKKTIVTGDSHVTFQTVEVDDLPF